MRAAFFFTAPQWEGVYFYVKMASTDETAILLYVLDELPNFVVICCYAVVVLWWARNYHEAEDSLGVFRGRVRPGVMVGMLLLFVMQVVVWAGYAASGQAKDTAGWSIYGAATSATAFFLMGVLFAAYGRLLARTLAMTPFALAIRRRKTQETRITAALCAVGFVIRALAVAIAAAASADDWLGFDTVFTGWDAGLFAAYYLLLEVVPAVALLRHQGSVPPIAPGGGRLGRCLYTRCPRRLVACSGLQVPGRPAKRAAPEGSAEGGGVLGACWGQRLSLGDAMERVCCHSCSARTGEEDNGSPDAAHARANLAFGGDAKGSTVPPVALGYQSADRAATPRATGKQEWQREAPCGRLGECAALTPEGRKVAAPRGWGCCCSVLDEDEDEDEEREEGTALLEAGLAGAAKAGYGAASLDRRDEDLAIGGGQTAYESLAGPEQQTPTAKRRSAVTFLRQGNDPEYVCDWSLVRASLCAVADCVAFYALDAAADNDAAVMAAERRRRPLRRRKRRLRHAGLRGGCTCCGGVCCLPVIVAEPQIPRARPSATLTALLPSTGERDRRVSGGSVTSMASFLDSMDTSTAMHSLNRSATCPKPAPKPPKRAATRTTSIGAMETTKGLVNGWRREQLEPG